jgi:hypothetical protein
MAGRSFWPGPEGVAPRKFYIRIRSIVARPSVSRITQMWHHFQAL